MAKKSAPSSKVPDAPLAYRAVLQAAAEDESLRKGARTTLRIRWAAAELLEQTSPDLLKVQDICGHLGIAQGTIYQYFPDRDRLLESLLQDFVGFLRERMQASTRHSTGPEDSARLATRAYCELFAHNTGLMRCLLNHYEIFPRAKSILSEFNRGWTDTIVAAISKNQRAGRGVQRTPEVELRRRTYALGGMIDQYLSWVYLGGDEHVAAVAGDLDAMVGTLTFIWAQAFQAEFRAVP